MLRTEFLIEDFCSIFWNEFQLELNQIYQEKGIVFESTMHSDIPGFIASCSATPIIGNIYYCVTVAWFDQGTFGAISFASSDDQYRLIGIGEKIEVENILTGQRRFFPEVAGPVTSNVMCTGLFNTWDDKEQFRTLLPLKFSGVFTIREKTL